jgi:hypothetical protein
MHLAHGCDQNSMLAFRRGLPYSRRMQHTSVHDTRTLTVVLPEADWRALRAAEPDAVAWIQRQIRSRLAGGHSPAPAPGDAGIDDEY